MKPITFSAFVMLSALTGLQARADSEIAVAMRYLQAEGVSHSQLYLFREDGKLLRQLTEEKSGQVHDPVFAPDGESIVFKIARDQTTEYWSVEPRGGNLHKLDAAPGWYSATKDAPYFTDYAPDPAKGFLDPKPTSQSTRAEDEKNGGASVSYKAPDGSQELILKSLATDQYAIHFLVCDLKTKKLVEMGRLHGEVGLTDLLHLSGSENDVFMMDPPLRAAFFFEHLDSMDGDTVFAIDLTGHKLVRLSQNWAMPVQLPGEAAFLTFTEARYQPIPGTKLTANGSFMDRWDSKLNRVRYGRDVPAICYGASMYRPGGKPTVVTIGDNMDQ